MMEVSSILLRCSLERASFLYTTFRALVFEVSLDENTSLAFWYVCGWRGERRIRLFVSGGRDSRR